MRTLQEFVSGDLALGDLEQLSLLTGFRFKDLPDSRQRKINNRSIRGILLSEHTDEQSRFDLFDRINTGSLAANKAEVRRGALGGPFLDLVINLAKDKTFKKLAPVSDRQEKLREFEELITRFFAYGDGLDDYRDRVSPFLFDYSRKMNKVFERNPELIEAYKSRFQDTMKFVDDVFPYGFRRNAKGKATPRARFEAISLGSYHALQQNPDLADSQIDVKPWLESPEFKRVIGSDGANATGRLKARVEFVRDRLMEG